MTVSGYSTKIGVIDGRIRMDSFQSCFARIGGVFSVSLFLKPYFWEYIYREYSCRPHSHPLPCRTLCPQIQKCDLTSQFHRFNYQVTQTTMVMSQITMTIPPFL